MKRRILLATALLLANTVVFAHTDLTTSIPADNAMLDKPPAELTLTFGAKVQLVGLQVQDSQGKTIETGFKATKDKEKSFKQKLPTLPAETYTVHWVAMGGDTHKMKGDLSFMVHGAGGHLPSHAHPPADDHHTGSDR